MFRKTRLAWGVLVALAAVHSVRAAPIELVQAGDAEMTCQALTAEMNALSAARAKAAKRAESGRKLLGFASTALQVASSSGLLGKGQGGYAGQQALATLQAQAQQQQMMAAQQQAMAAATQGLAGFGAGVDPPAAAPAAPPADTSVASQRLARLTDLHTQKGC